MLDIADELNRWLEEGRDFAVATVAAVSGSAPRGPGAALAVDADGTAIGSVSGGCVEGAVYDLCTQALKDGQAVLERFGYSDEDAFAVGLSAEEMALMRRRAAEGKVYGVGEDSERTTVEVLPLRRLLSEPLADWSAVGVLLQALVGEME